MFRFRVDSLNGSLYVQGALDRETASHYFLSAEAIDGGGLRAPAEIQIIVTDVNDNPPLFRRSDYEGVVREKEAAFMRPIIVEVSLRGEICLVYARIVGSPLWAHFNASF